MLKQVLISKSNLEFAIKIQNEIFPDYNARQNYTESVLGTTKNEYYLLYNDTTCVGISGLYFYDIDPTSAWLGWFGIKKEYRRCGFGSQALRLFEKTAKKKGFKSTRLYTDKFDNETAISFYKSNGYSFEEYECTDDKAALETKILIASKSIDGSQVVPWSNKNINLTGQIKKQSICNPVLLTQADLDSVTNLYKSCFIENKYFVDFFKGKNLSEIMDTSFRCMFDFCLKHGFCYGIFDDTTLVGVVLSFDFFDAKTKYIREFNNIFTSDYDNDNYPYKEKFHDVVETFARPIIYILAVCIDSQYRGYGYSKLLINKMVERFGKSHTIISDVTSERLLRVFKDNGFLLDIIDDDYYLVHKTVMYK